MKIYSPLCKAPIPMWHLSWAVKGNRCLSADWMEVGENSTQKAEHPHMPASLRELKEGYCDCHWNSKGEGGGQLEIEDLNGCQQEDLFWIVFLTKNSKKPWYLEPESHDWIPILIRNLFFLCSKGLGVGVQIN
jgi:hypothetical protein